jgi:2-dehydropantoate 2-reductase
VRLRALRRLFAVRTERPTRGHRLADKMLDTLLAGFTLPHTKTTVLQDWMKGRRSEVDDLNGLVAAEAARLGRAAPVNAAIAELAHRVEQSTIKPDQANLRLLRDLVQR